MLVEQRQTLLVARDRAVRRQIRYAALVYQYGRPFGPLALKSRLGVLPTLEDLFQGLQAADLVDFFVLVGVYLLRVQVGFCVERCLQVIDQPFAIHVAWSLTSRLLRCQGRDLCIADLFVVFGVVFAQVLGGDPSDGRDVVDLLILPFPLF